MKVSYSFLELFSQFQSNFDAVKQLANVFPDENTKIELMDILEYIQNNPDDTIDDKNMRSLAEIFDEYRAEHGMNELEYEKYREVFGVDDEKNQIIFGSFRVENSSRVYWSQEVRNSQRVKASNTVYDSSRIQYGKQIINSKFVSDSYNVEAGAYIARGTNITDSFDVALSQDISNSSHIYRSRKIIDSSGVKDSKDSQSIYFSSGLAYCDHCLFCSGLKKKSFHIFNQPVNEKDWFVIKEILMKRYWDFDRSYPVGKIVKIQEDNTEWCGFRLDDITEKSVVNYYSSFSPAFWNYVRTIPLYNDFLLYRITLHPGVLDSKN